MIRSTACPRCAANTKPNYSSLTAGCGFTYLGHGGDLRTSEVSNAADEDLSRPVVDERIEAT